MRSSRRCRSRSTTAKPSAALPDVKSGLFPARIKNGLYGFIDRKGTVALEAKFKRALQFSEGLAPVMDDTNRWGYIDDTGKFKIVPQYKAYRFFVLADGRIVIVDPSAFTIVYIISA